MMTPQPAVLLVKWRQRDRHSFDNNHSDAEVKRCINTVQRRGMQKTNVAILR
jgi:hypothetical protein